MRKIDANGVRKTSLTKKQKRETVEEKRVERGGSNN